MEWAFQEFSIHLAVKSALVFVRQKYFCTFLIIRQPARKGESQTRGLLWVSCVWSWKIGIRSAKANTEPGNSRTCQHLGAPWALCTRTNIFLCIFPSSLPICLLPCPEGGEVPSCAWHYPGVRRRWGILWKISLSKRFRERKETNGFILSHLIAEALRYEEHPKATGSVPLTPSPAFNHLPS